VIRAGARRTSSSPSPPGSDAARQDSVATPSSLIEGGHAPWQMANAICGRATTFLPFLGGSLELWRRACVREACPPVLPYGRMTVDHETPMLLPPDLRDWSGPSEQCSKGLKPSVGAVPGLKIAYGSGKRTPFVTAGQKPGNRSALPGSSKTAQPFCSSSAADEVRCAASLLPAGAHGSRPGRAAPS
jgi:hypothetical protein